MLERDIDGWNLYRKRHPKVVLSLAGRDLSAKYLFEGNFRGCDLQGASLRGACLIGADFSGADLSGADLRGAYLCDANLYGANLRGAQIAGANMDRADLRAAALFGVRLNLASTQGTLMSASGLAGKKSVEGRKSAGAARLQKSNERSHRRAAYQPVRLSAVVAGGVFLSVLTLFASRWVALGGDWLGVFALRDTSPVEEVQLPIVEAAQVVSPPAVLDLSLAQSMDGSSQVWSLATHTQQDGRSLLIGGGKDGQIEIWDRESGQMLQTLPGHNDTVRTLAVAPSGEWLVSGSGDGLKVWQLETGLLMHSIPCGHGPIWSVSISPDGETFVSGDSDGNVSTWRLQDGRLLRNVNIGVPVWSVAVGPEGASFVSGSSDRTIRQWDLQQARC